MKLRNWCPIGIVFPVKLSIEIVRGDASRYSHVNLARFHFIITSDALVLLNLIVSCFAMMTAPKLAQIRFQVGRSWSFSHFTL